MSNVFRNALVLSETVVGSMLDLRPLVLYEQPKDIDFSSDSRYTTDENGNLIETDLLTLVDTNRLKEIFVGFADEKITKISKINGWNAYGVSYLKADVEISSDLCDFPVETGSVITDNAIVNPISIKVQAVLPTAFATRIYDEMARFYQQKKYIMVQTKFAMYRNFVIEAMPFKMENETIDRPIVELSLRQVMEVEPQYVTTGNNNQISKPIDASDMDTQDIGRTQSKSVVKSLKQRAE